MRTEWEEFFHSRPHRLLGAHQVQAGIEFAHSSSEICQPGQLEPEDTSYVEAAASCQVRSRNRVAGELGNGKRVPKRAGASSILDEGIHGREIGVIQRVQGGEPELKRRPFVELYQLGEAGIEVVERSVAPDVPWRVAKRRAENGLGNSGIGDVPDLIVRHGLDRRSARSVSRIQADELR